VTRILVTGGSGQIGTELHACRWPAGFHLVCPSRAEMDLSDVNSIRAYLNDGKFDGILNSGAYTAVDRAESDVAAAWAVNALAPAVLAEQAARVGIPIVQLSTDYVFDGRKIGAYAEEDAVAPLNVYGASKEAGEQAVRTVCKRHVILRTSWVISPHGQNFVKTMLRLGQERESIRVVADQHGGPTLAADIAAVVSEVFVRLLEDPERIAGTYHFSSAGQTTWFGLASFVFNRIGNAKSPELTPISSSAYAAAAPRPGNSLLSNDKIVARLGIRSRPWEEAVAEVLHELGVTGVGASGQDVRFVRAEGADRSSLTKFSGRLAHEACTPCARSR
jgi:dTDP-4-dehydrorhamnose reductase